MKNDILAMRKANVKIAAYSRILERIDYQLDYLDEEIQEQESYGDESKYLESLRAEKKIYQSIMQGISKQLDDSIKDANKLYMEELGE